MKRAIVTVVTRNYAHYAYALAESVQEHEPNVEFFLCFADTPSNTESINATSGIHIFQADGLGIAKWKRFAFQYTPFELSCALKPFAMSHVLSHGYDEVVYLDGDMRLFSRLDAVWQLLDDKSIVLTPHLISPFPQDGGRPGEDLFLMAGTFNAGFLALRNDNQAREFITWWSRKMEAECYKDLAASIFVDQKWLSLVPGLFGNVGILRNPAYNTGHWTLPQFALSTDVTGSACIAGQKIALFHFSNFCPEAPNEFENCQDRMLLSEIPMLHEMVASYHAALAQHTAHKIDRECEFSRLDDGTEIHPAWREAIRRNHPSFANISDPFDTTSNRQLVEAFRAVEPKARKWRKDWRLKGVTESAPRRSKKLKLRLKGLLRAAGLRKKAA